MLRRGMVRLRVWLARPSWSRFSRLSANLPRLVRLAGQDAVYGSRQAAARGAAGDVRLLRSPVVLGLWVAQAQSVLVTGCTRWR